LGTIKNKAFISILKVYKRPEQLPGSAHIH